MSGALRINYAKSSEYPAHKGVYVPSKKSKLSKAEPTTELESWLDLFLDTRDPFVPRRGYRTSPSYEEHPGFQNSVKVSVFIVETDPKSVFCSFIWQDTHKNRQWDEILTRGYTTHFQTDQETIEDPRKRKIAERFAVLAQREDNWDGYDSKKPTEQILEHAQAVIEGFVDTVISNRYVLLTPFISTDEAGHITVQWNKKSRELHLHITQQESRYLKVWGPNINTEMEEGILNSDEYIMLWEWLTL